MKKYTTIAQKGEMAYGQPTYPVAISSTEDKENELTVRIRRITTTVQVDDEEPKTRVQYRSFTIRSGKTTVVNKWRKAFTKSGWKCPEPPAIHKGDYTLYGTRWFDVHRKDTVRIEWYWVAQANCYQDVEDLANYFGDRLPKAFYERYANILVEIPDVPAHEA